MNAFGIAATALLVLLVPLAAVMLWRDPIDCLIALELGGALVVLVLLALPEAFHRSTYYAVAVIAAPLTWLSGLIYARFLGRFL